MCGPRRGSTGHATGNQVPPPLHAGYVGAPTEGAVKLAPELDVNLRSLSKTFGPPNDYLSPRSLVNGQLHAMCISPEGHESSHKLKIRAEVARNQSATTLFSRTTAALRSIRWLKPGR